MRQVLQTYVDSIFAPLPGTSARKWFYIWAIVTDNSPPVNKCESWKRIDWDWKLFDDGLNTQNLDGLEQWRFWGGGLRWTIAPPNTDNSLPPPKENQRCFINKMSNKYPNNNILAPWNVFIYKVSPPLRISGKHRWSRGQFKSWLNLSA